MADDFNIQRHFEHIGLWNKFPEKITRADLFSVSFHDSGSNVQYKTFWERIIHFDGTCRYFRINKGTPHHTFGYRASRSVKDLQNEGDRGIHPLDISTAVFLCCDHVARQDLVLHFWGCKHAFPFVIKAEQLEPPVMYMSPIKIISLRSGGTNEIPLMDCRFKTVSAVRFSKQQKSKSDILNILISTSEKVHSTFFHRNCEGSIQNRSSLCDGMVETLPHFDSELGQMLLLNLRGNCNESSNQTKFLLQSSVVMIFVCRLDEIHLIETLLETTDKSKTCECFCIVLTEGESRTAKVDEFSKRIKISHEIIYCKKRSQFDLRSDLLKCIAYTKGYCSSQDLEEHAKQNYFSTDLECIEYSMSKADEFYEKVVQKYRETNYSRLFPMQGQDCLQWSEADLDIYKLRHRKLTEPIREYREHLEKKKGELRHKQLELIEQSNLTIDFSNDLTSAESELNSEIFLRNLNLNFDNLTRENWNRLHKEYEKLLNDRMIDQSNIQEIDMKLDKVEEQINSHSLSLGSFFREMGQIYETLNSNKIKASTNQIVYTTLLPKAAVQLLICGYQIEIMDGRSNSIPIAWVQSVLTELKTILNNVRIRVITVLGIQGSGKSTLLNIMFGSQFPVSSGRCTRGVHMHLAKVSNDKYQVDYFIVIDTEGLFSAEAAWDKSHERDQKERELATFVIGISNITVINIIGEDLTYLKDVLPIAVHAFLRMNLVGLNPKCRILHQNVDKSKREAIIRHKTRTLEAELDRQTRAACKIENVKDRRFADIIRFDITKDTDYFPPLFETVNGFEVISPSYGQAVMQLKNKLLTDSQATGSLEELICHVGHLWNAIKKENFVYEFRNTIETEARIYMDGVICNLHWQTVREWQKLASDFHAEVSTCSDLEHLDSIKNIYREVAKILSEEQRTKNMDILSARMQKKSVGESTRNSEARSLVNLDKIVRESKVRSNGQFDRDVKCRKIEIRIHENDIEACGEIDQFIRSSLESTNTNDDHKMISDKIFVDWFRQQQTSNTCKEEFDYENDAYDRLYTHFALQRPYIDKALNMKSITKRHIEEFLLESSYWCKRTVAYEKEKDMAKKVVTDIKLCLEYKHMEIREMSAFYKADIFTDLILEVKNNPYILDRKLSTNSSFEIDLALCLCGSFINKMKEMEKDTVIMSCRLKENTEDFFKSRVREILTQYKSVDLARSVEEVTFIIYHNIRCFMLDQFAQILAFELQEKCALLKTKLGLFYFVYSEVLENYDILPTYLNSPAMAIQNYVSRKVERTFGQNVTDDENQLRRVINENAKCYINLVCEKLSTIEFSERDIMKQKEGTMEVCTERIVESLGSFLPLTRLKQHVHDRIGHIDPQKVIESLIKKVVEDECKILSEIEEVLFQETPKSKKIKCETAHLIMENFIGCEELCPFCGEMCCNVQKDHDGDHMAVMHRPIGLKEFTSEWTPTTCWEEMERNCQDGQSGSEYSGWVIPMDVSVEENRFWKYVSVKYVEGKAHQIGVQSPSNIPESWKRLTKEQVLSELNSMAQKITEI